MLRKIQTGDVTVLAEKACGDRQGSAGVIFALALVPLVMLIGLTIDFSRATTMRQRLQVAADTAATGATSAAVNNTSGLSTPEQLAAYVWNANTTDMPVVCPPKVAVTAGSGVTTATVSCSGTMKTSFSSLMGFDTMPLSVTATATGKVATSATNIGLAGFGLVAGDPHANYMNGTNRFDSTVFNSINFLCPSSSTNWYNLLSDKGIEVNVSCYSPNGLLNYGNESYVYDIAVVVEGHTIRLTQTPQETPANLVSLPSDWKGQITIDGQTYSNPAPKIANYLLHGQDFNTQVVANAAPGTGLSAADFLTNVVYNLYSIAKANGGYYENGAYTIATPYYTIYVGYFPFGGSGTIALYANDVGQCGTPGGFWGQLMTNKTDTTVNDFVVSGPYATTAQYSEANCTTAVPVRLTK